jgi:hypothetical protein
MKEQNSYTNLNDDDDESMMIIIIVTTTRCLLMLENQLKSLKYTLNSEESSLHPPK